MLRMSCIARKFDGNHISDIITKASRALNFIKRNNLSKCSSQVKESVYLMMIRPQLEYASNV